MEISSNEIYRLVFKEYPDVLDVKQVCNLLGICEKTAYKLIRQGDLPSMRVGRHHKITKVAVMRYLKVLETSKPAGEFDQKIAK